MEIEFREYDGSTVALNPRIEHRGGRLTMKLNEQNCDYFLLFSRMPGGRVDLHEEEVQQAIVKAGELLPDVHDKYVTNEISFSCIEWSDYRVNDYAIELSNKIAEYTIAGCRDENGRLVVYIPDEDISCTASVSLTVSYRISQINGVTARRLFGKEMPQQSFYAVEFDNIPDYQDGGIVFTFDGNEMEYPITAEMIEKGRVFIETGCGKPIFSTKICGLELQQA